MTLAMRMQACLMLFVRAVTAMFEFSDRALLLPSTQPGEVAATHQASRYIPEQLYWDYDPHGGPRAGLTPTCRQLCWLGPA
jgi:hypothetical protein